MNYYPFHIGDYASATRHLSWDEDAAYRRLLDVYYTTEKPLPLDMRQVFRLVTASTELQREAVETVLAEFFDQTKDGWQHTRCDEEIARMQNKRDANDEKAEHERERMKRHRERRSKMFEDLRSVGVTPAWDVSITELQRLHTEHCNAPATHLQREHTETCNAPATAIPTPTPTPTPKENKEAQAPLPDWLPLEPWAGYVEMRKKIRKPMTPRAQRLVLDSLAGMLEKGFDIEQALNNSTRNSWIDVYEPKGGGRSTFANGVAL